MTTTRHPIVVRRTEVLIALSIASAILFVNLVSCKRGDDDGSAPLVAGDAGRPREVVRSAQGDGGITGDPQVLGFLLAADDQAIQRATVAESKTADSTVRDFAAKMVKDHGAAAEELREIARQKGVSPATSGPSKDMESDSNDTIQELDGLKGASFDRRYLEEEIILQLKEMAAIDQDVAPIAVDLLVSGAVSDARAASVAQREQARDVLRAVQGDAGPPAPTSISTSSVDSSAPDARALSGAGEVEAGVEIQ